MTAGSSAEAAVWAGTYSPPYSSPDRPRLAGVYQCPGCTNASLAIWHVFFAQYSDPQLTDEYVWPTPQARELEDVADLLQVDRLEAWNAHLHGLNRAAILMARSALQRAARHLLTEAGVEQKRRPLEAELDLLVKEGVIIQQLRDNAEEVRLWGNDVAHPEEMGRSHRGRGEGESGLPGRLSQHHRGRTDPSEEAEGSPRGHL